MIVKLWDQEIILMEIKIILLSWPWRKMNTHTHTHGLEEDLPVMEA